MRRTPGRVGFRATHPHRSSGGIRFHRAARAQAGARPSSRAGYPGYPAITRENAWNPQSFASIPQCLFFPRAHLRLAAKRHVAPLAPAGQARRRNTALEVFPRAKCLVPRASCLLFPPRCHDALMLFTDTGPSWRGGRGGLTRQRRRRRSPAVRRDQCPRRPAR